MLSERRIECLLLGFSGVDMKGREDERPKREKEISDAMCDVLRYVLGQPLENERLHSLLFILEGWGEQYHP